MSSFKNAKPRRKYRQRAQPAARQELGILQKKKDYKQRAKNYHQKQDKLKKLRLKASLKNQNEYYFRMNKSKTKDGKVIQFDSDESDFEQKQYRKQLKTENNNIVNMQHSIEANKSKKLLSELHLIDTPKINKHTIFTDNQEDVKNFKIDEFYDTVPDFYDRSIIYTKKQLQTLEVQNFERNQLAKQRYKQLQQTLGKQQKMKKMMLKIQHEKNLLGKQRRKIKKWKGKKCHKFFLERKR